MPVYDAEVVVMLRPAILDPQGRAVQATLERLGHANVRDLRIGKRIVLTLEGEPDAVEAQLNDVARSVLSNPVLEDVEVTLRERSAGADAQEGERNPG